MGKSFYTGKDSELQLGSANFAAKILATPLAYGSSSFKQPNMGP